MPENILEVITKPNVIIGLILLVAALIIALFSEKIAAKFLRNEDRDRVVQISLRIKSVALVAAFVGAILAVVL